MTHNEMVQPGAENTGEEQGEEDNIEGCHLCNTCCENLNVCA
jgi:hypothetical protein